MLDAAVFAMVFGEIVVTRRKATRRSREWQSAIGEHLGLDAFRDFRKHVAQSGCGKFHRRNPARGSQLGEKRKGRGVVDIQERACDEWRLASKQIDRTHVVGLHPEAAILDD